MNHRFQMLRKHKRGFTLAEMAIVLGVVSLIITAIWVAASSVSEKNKINKLNQELQTIVQNMMTLYQNRPVDRNDAQPWSMYGCGAATPNANATLISTGVIPGWAVSAPTLAVTPWGGPLVVYNPSSPPAPINSFRLSFYCLPRDACIALILQATNCDPMQFGCPTKVLTYTGNGHDTPNPGPPKTWQNIDVTEAERLCALNALDPAANSVEFDYNL